MTLTPTEGRFVVNLGDDTGPTKYVKLGLVDGALIDNVAVQVIEGVAVPLPLWVLVPIAGGILAVSRRRLVGA